MHPTDALHTLLWEAGGVHCILIRHDSDPSPFEIVIFEAEHIVKNAVFVGHDAAADFAIAQMHAYRGM